MLAYKLGNQSAFEELYLRHSPKVYGFLCNRLRSRSVVDEVFQEAFLRLHRYRERYDAALPFLPWLFTLTRSAMIDRLRKDSRQQQTETNAVNLEQQNTASAETEIDLGILSDNERAVLELRFDGGYAYEQIAAHLETSAVNVRKILSRAVQKLRTAFGVS